MVWLLIIVFLIGASSGCLIADTSSKRKKTVGTLRIDRSDPDEGPYIFLELNVDPGVVEKKKRIFLAVDTKSYLSHE